MVQRRSDIVGIDAAILVASGLGGVGHLETFTDHWWTVFSARNAGARTRSTASVRTVVRRSSPRRERSISCSRPRPVRSRARVPRPTCDPRRQGMFTNFNNVLAATRKKPPFASPRSVSHFATRSRPELRLSHREFEQMEMEYLYRR